MNFDFYMPAKVVSGYGCVGKNASLFKNFGTRCLIITSGSSAKKSGALNDVTAALESAGIKYSVFDKIGQNPLVSVCYEAGSEARKTGAQFIIGIGGGSPMDASKSAAIFAANKEMKPSDIFSGSYPGGALPLCLIGTTAGTGSEVTPFSVLTTDWNHQKKSVKSPLCYAKAVFADPRYTFSCPYDVTVSTALDAICHSVESYYTVNSSDASRSFALRAAELIWPELVKFRKSASLPSEPEREALFYGSLWAGLAINATGTCFPHSAGYPLTTEHGIAHGKACAVFLPYFISHNASADLRLTTEFFEHIGCIMDEFCMTIKDLTLPLNVKLTEEQCVKYAKDLEGRNNLVKAVNPSKPDEILNIYSELFK